ncbi:hypothetical protein VPH35_065716 [Triticum aestivum]
MASSPLLLLFLLVLALACTCRASSGHAVEVDPTCPPAKASAVAVQASDYGGPHCQPPAPHVPVPVFLYDVNPMQFTLNLEYTEAEFFLHAAAIQNTVGGFLRPKIDLSANNFARVMDQAFGYHLNPPFDPYIHSLNFLLASYFLAGLLGVEVGQDAVFHALLFERKHETVPPYKGITVAEFTDRVSTTRNQLVKGCPVGTTCSPPTGTPSPSRRTPAELLRITGNEHIPGGF